MAQDDLLGAVHGDDLLDLAHHHHHLVARGIDPGQRRAAAGPDLFLFFNLEALGHEQDMRQGFLLCPAAGRCLEQGAAHHEPCALARHLGMPVG